jgi:hypothetical protein
MKKKLNKKDLAHLEGHRLKTRRDFLAHGFLSMCTSVMAPSFLTMLMSKQALAMDCIAPAAGMSNQKTPIIIFDLAGGANFAGSSIVVGGRGGQNDFLESYGALGLPPDMHPNRTGMTNNELGLLHHADSPYLRGIQSVTSTEVRSKVDGGVFCSVSADDTGNNPHNPMYWLNKAGAQGEIAQLLGTNNSESGGRSLAPIASVNPAIAPVRINTPADVLNLVSVGRLSQLFNDEKAQRVLQSIERLSENRIRQISSQSLPEQIRTLVQCGYIQSRDLMNQFSADVLDPRLDQDVQALFNLNNADQRRTASIAKLVLDGHAGVGTITKGGYDYHDGTRRTGERRDFEAGALIGQVMQLAARKGKNVMIYVFTDGGCSTRPVIDDTAEGRGKYNWTGDSSVRSSSFMFVYRHQGRATLRQAGHRQIGHFRTNGAIESSATLVSNNVTNLVKAVVANYLALHGEEGRLAQVVGDNPFGNNLDQYLFFNRIV